MLREWRRLKSHTLATNSATTLQAGCLAICKHCPSVLPARKPADAYWQPAGAPAVGAEEDGLGVVLGQDLEVDDLRVQVPIKLHGQLLHVVAAHLQSSGQGGTAKAAFQPGPSSSFTL